MLIDLYLAALSSINYTSMQYSLVVFTGLFMGLGVFGALAIPLVEYVWERLGRLDELDYWLTAHNDDDGVVRSPATIYTVPQFMQSWPTLQSWPTWEEKLAADLARQEREWQEEGLTDLLVEAIGWYEGYSHKMDQEYAIANWFEELEVVCDVPEPVAYLANEEAELDELWERISPRLGRHPANLNEYMRAQVARA